MRRSGPRLSGKRIIIDPGRGGADHGLIMHGPDGPISEADILWDLASRLEGRMTAIGMETFLSRPANRAPSDAERAATANTVGADLMISLRCATQASPAANGVASFHFGNSHGSVSTIGRNLADFIQREVVARTGLRDCRTHGRTWDLLRLTRMPTVQVDVGYITNPRDRAMLVSTRTRDSIAEGILAAVKRLYLLGKNDRPTGTFTFAELLAHELSVDQAGPRQLAESPEARADPVSLAVYQGLRSRRRRAVAVARSPAAAPARLDVGLPAQPLLQVRAAAAGSTGVGRHHDEAHRPAGSRRRHALVHRAVTEHLDGGRRSGGTACGSRVRSHRRCGRRLPAPARRVGPDRRRPQRSGCAASPSVPCPDSTPTEVSKTASALTGPVGNRGRAARRRGGA